MNPLLNVLAPGHFNFTLSFFSSLSDQFYQCFIYKSRYHYITGGLKNTLIITLFAVLLGVILGTIVAVIRATHIDNPKRLKIANGICTLYLTVIRGTPELVQLMIMYYIILSPIGLSDITSAILAFGINSGAYVAEVIRSGIQSVDRGQMEAGRSLGLSQKTTMTKIVFPGAEKCSARHWKRIYYSAERHLHCRIHRHSGTDQRRRHDPQHHISSVYASADDGCGVFGYCHWFDFGSDPFRKEAAQK